MGDYPAYVERKVDEYNDRGCEILVGVLNESFTAALLRIRAKYSDLTVVYINGLDRPTSTETRGRIIKILELYITL
jgi:hypothetical protein